MSFNVKINIDNLIINAVISGSPETLYLGNSDIHSHYSFECHCVREGSLEFSCEGKTVTSAPGTLYLIAPYSYHSVRDCTGNVKKLSIIFTLCEKKSYRSHSNAFEFYSSVYNRLSGINCIDIDEAYINDLFECLKRFVSDGKIDYEAFTSLFCIIFKKMTSALGGGDFIFNTVEKNELQADTSDDERAMMADYYIETHYGDDITTDDLARHLNLSTRQTNRFLKEYMKTSFGDYIRKYRIEIAKSLVLQGNMSLKEISEAVGYKSYNGFFNAFVLVTGNTPTQYEAMMRK